MLALTMFYDISNSPHTPICPIVSSNDNEEDRGKENEEDRREGRGGARVATHVTRARDMGAFSFSRTNFHD